ncbi:hypothetical protein [Peribacillus sp. FSL E2-0218]|uniref:hypothetical protein n=1 Tax=Peribacillus sp. FSL E2-0218 TaxID=2921364 RepID=UPI0030EDCFA1
MKWPIRKHSSIRTYSLAGAIVTAIALFLEDIASMVSARQRWDLKRAYQKILMD